MTDDPGVLLGDQNFISEQIRRYFSGARILFFGSRMRGDHKQYSDLDLCVDAGQALDLATLSKLEESLSQSDLKYKVDISDWQRMTDDFREHILKRHILW